MQISLKTQTPQAKLDRALDVMQKVENINKTNQKSKSTRRQSYDGWRPSTEIFPIWRCFKVTRGKSR